MCCQKNYSMLVYHFSHFLLRLSRLSISSCRYLFFFPKLLLMSWKFSTCNCEIVWCFINASNKIFTMEFFQVLFNIWVILYWFCFFIKFCYFSFNLGNTLSFHGLKVEVVYLNLSVIVLIHVWRRVVDWINSLEKFIVRVGGLYSFDILLGVFLICRF